MAKPLLGHEAGFGHKLGYNFRYALVCLIQIVCFSGICLSLFILNLFDKLPDLQTVICIVLIETVFLYAQGLSTLKFRPGE